MSKVTDRPKIIERLKNEKVFILVSHMLPDGDSIGSLLAMGEGLQQLGKEVSLYTPGPIPRKYTFLQGSERVLHKISGHGEEVTALVLDCSDPERLGSLRETVMKRREIINIDHHVTNQSFGTLNLVDSAAAATGEIAYHILKDLGVAMTITMAESLYVAIASDTGSFKFDNTMPATHRVAASLLEYGLNPGLLSQRIFDQRPLAFYALLKDALSSLEFYAGRRLAVMTLSKDIRERSGAGSDDLDGIVNYTRNIEGVELGILFYVESEDETKVGFRSKAVDVSILAGKLNGGGHARAAGSRLRGDFEKLKKKVIDEACAMLKDLPA